jgi:hypothetical protein
MTKSAPHPSFLAFQHAKDSTMTMHHASAPSLTPDMAVVVILSTDEPTAAAVGDSNGYARLPCTPATVAGWGTVTHVAPPTGGLLSAARETGLPRS